ncbi:copper homeostasis protein CutC [Butyricimonas hominis]|uniref:PF03932 family protein CutC n=1 Tax=Butyricimonas hominis TaxID=2763032 RepID=A0ABR7CZA3_9BACT|nr:copper homeostasis protein CutC [Butyricimonas hominis]MBC5621001.1 copper homeostasis protein CutC [Butyricimonas hominis]
MKRNIEVEVCTFSLESCMNAQTAGANRVELCAAMYDGGTTPSAGIIRMARKLLSIELYVMIRPRGGDFLYSGQEFELMKEEIRHVKESGADGVVLGILKADGTVDVERTRELVELAAPLKVTFHRAIDMTRDLNEALEDVIRAGCYRVLTSGGRNTVAEGLEQIRVLTKRAAGRVQVMAGSGVNAANTRSLLDAGVDAVHLSGKSGRDSRMVYRNPDVSMGGVPGLPEYEQYYSDVEKIEAVVKEAKDDFRF